MPERWFVVQAFSDKGDDRRLGQGIIEICILLVDPASVDKEQDNDSVLRRRVVDLSGLLSSWPYNIVRPHFVDTMHSKYAYVYV